MTRSRPRRARKLSPVHPGEILNEEFLIPMKLTQYRLAREVGVDPRRVHAIIHGERSITAETAPFVLALFRELGRVLDEPAKPVRSGTRTRPLGRTTRTSHHVQRRGNSLRER